MAAPCTRTPIRQRRLGGSAPLDSPTWAKLRLGNSISAGPMSRDLQAQGRPFPSRGVKLSLLRRLLAPPCVQQPMCTTVLPTRDPRAMQPARACGLTAHVQPSYPSGSRRTFSQSQATVSLCMVREAPVPSGIVERGRLSWLQWPRSSARCRTSMATTSSRATPIQRQSRARNGSRPSCDHHAQRHRYPGSAMIRRLLHSNMACFGHVSIRMSGIDPPF